MRELRERRQLIQQFDYTTAEANVRSLASARYYPFFMFVYLTIRLSQLDNNFVLLLEKERTWPTKLPSGEDLYSKFYQTTHNFTVNIVCGSCGIIDHDVDNFRTVSVTDSILSSLCVPSEVYVPFDFSSGVSNLDARRIMVDIESIKPNSSLSLCLSCHKSLQRGFIPSQALANFRWTGPVPAQLLDLTWLEEILIARAHVIGRIVRLEERKAQSHFALKGHTILLPQDTTRLLDLLSMSLSLLPNIVRVVWSGKSQPQKQNLRSHFTVRTRKIYDALQWLCQNHEDYRHVMIDEERIASWESTMVATELLEMMGHTSDTVTEEASRSGFATEDLDTVELRGIHAGK